MARLTQFGFERSNRTDIINELSLKFRAKFGNDLLLTDDSIAGSILAIMAERRLELEKMMEDVYFSRTLNGAEGIYLDDALGYFHFPRRGRLEGSGVGHINYNAVTTASNQSATVGSTMSADNSITYEVLVETILSQNVTGMYLDASTLTIGSYDFSLRNTITDEVVVTTLDIITGSTPEKTQFAQDLRDFWLDNTSDNAPFITLNGLELYIGYNSALDFTAISEPTSFFSSPKIGELWSGVEVTAETKGFNPLESGGITGFSPTFTGYLGATNTLDFFAGAENETDAEYRIRFESTRGSFPTTTREGLADEVRKLDTVTSVRIYDNPTLTDKVEADRKTFNTVVRGGVNSEIAQTIYDNKPINVRTSGVIGIPVLTSDGDSEVINFTKASSYDADIRLRYVLNNQVPLSTAERVAIQDGLENLFTQGRIGDKFYGTQMSAAALSGVSSNRIISLIVESKKDIEPDASFSADPLTPLYYEYVTMKDLVFSREV